MSKILNRIAQTGIIITLTLLWGACASYQLGTGAELPFKSLYVQPVINNSFAPQTQQLLSNQLAQAFIRDGRVNLVSDPEKADAILRVELTNYHRSPSVVDSTDTGRTRSFSLEIAANCSLYNSKDNKSYFDSRNVSTNIHSLTDSGAQPAEYQNIPVLARRLAQRILDTTLGTW